MTVTLVINGSSYFYPETGDTNWGPEATDWASAVTSGMLQKAGGLFVLLSEVDFGGSFGLKSIYFKSRTASPASAGVVRLANADTVAWRNFADDGDLALSVNASNNLLFNGSPIGVIASIADTNSVDLDITSTVLTANLKLSAASASALNQLVTLSIETDGLKAQIPNASIISAIPNATSSVTGLLTNADWTTFNNKQDAGVCISSLTGDVTASGPGAAAATIANGAVSLAKMANLAANSIIGNNTGSPATPLALTGAQVTAMLSTISIGGGGTGQTTANAAFNALSPLTTKGDIVVFSGGVNARIPVGANTFVLTADSSQTAGIKWAASASSTSGTYTPSVSGKTGQLSAGTVTPAVAQYSQVGTTVTVGGKITMQAAGGGDGSFAMSIPVTSAFASNGNCGGNIQPDVGNGSSSGYGIKAVASSATVLISASFGATGSFDWYYSFTYQVI